MKLSNLTDSQYLTYYLKRAQKTIDDYETFAVGLSVECIEYAEKVYQTYYIDICPYLYTINNISPHAYSAFLTYLHHYLMKADYNDREIALLIQVKSEIHKPTNVNLHGLVMLLKCSNLMLVSVLFLMQYYFL
jgi:hypothetical protein